MLHSQSLTDSGMLEAGASNHQSEAASWGCPSAPPHMVICLTGW